MVLSRRLAVFRRVAGARLRRLYDSERRNAKASRISARSSSSVIAEGASTEGRPTEERKSRRLRASPASSKMPKCSFMERAIMWPTMEAVDPESTLAVRFRQGPSIPAREETNEKAGEGGGESKFGKLAISRNRRRAGPWTGGAPGAAARARATCDDGRTSWGVKGLDCCPISCSNVEVCGLDYY